MEAPAGLTARRIVYLYGFVALPCDLPEVRGVDGDTDVCLIASGGLGCAASFVDAYEYQPADPRSGQEQLAWVTPRALRHHDVLSRIHAATTVVPLKFGTLCESLEDVQAIVDERRAAIADLLQRLRGKDEWTLGLSLDEEAVAESLRHSVPQLVAMQEAERGLPQGQAYFARKRLQKATSVLASSRLADVERDVCARLVNASVDVTPFTREARPDGSTRLVASALVARERFAPFEAALADLEGDHLAIRMSFEVGGPWPPYSFAAVFA